MQLRQSNSLQPRSNVIPRRITGKASFNAHNGPVKFKKTKLDSVHTDENSELETSLNNMMLEDRPLVYQLPQASNLKTPDEISRFHSNVVEIIRRNRADIDTSVVEESLRNIDFDEHLGTRYFMNCYSYMESFECAVDPVGADCLEGTGITASYRQKLVASLFRICRRLGTDVYSVHQALLYLDRYMKNISKTVTREEYLRIGLMCWYIGVKFDMVYYPNLEDACTLINIEDIATVRVFEFEILQVIGFNINLHGPIVCLRPLSMIHQCGESHTIAKFLLDLSYFSYEFSGQPSFVMATAVYVLALAVVKKTENLDQIYPVTCKYVSGLSVENIMPILKNLCHIVYNFVRHPSNSVYYEIRNRHSIASSLINQEIINVFRKIIRT